MKNTGMNINARIRSFKHSFDGIKSFFEVETNAWIHLLSTIIVLVASIFFGVSSIEWMFITISISLVWITEIINTCIERISDLITKDFHPAIKLIKDLAAGAVLIAGLSALVCGVVIFIPKILK